MVVGVVEEFAVGLSSAVPGVDWESSVNSASAVNPKCASRSRFSSFSN